MSIDKYLDRTHKQIAYNCAHFACEVWKDVTGKDIDKTLAGFLVPPSVREAKLSDLRKIVLLDKQEDPCLVLFQNKWHEPHVGVFIRGKVLHLTEKGVQYMPLSIASFGFTGVRFFKC